MKISRVALLAFLVERSHAFLTPQTANVAPTRNGSPAFVAEMAADTETDLSIPYDAAAELAYKGWIEKYDRPYDAARYEVFLSNYKAITVMNVSAKKKARDDPDGGKASLLSLNEYADCTAEEYQAAMKGETVPKEEAPAEPTSSGNILGDAVEAVQAQASASSALQEAADALEAEEEVCWEIFRIPRLNFGQT